MIPIGYAMVKGARDIWNGLKSAWSRRRWDGLLLQALVKEARPFGLWLLGLVTAYVGGLLLTRVPERRPLVAGTVLELLGACLVVWELGTLRHQFGKPGLPQAVAGWFRRLGAVVVRPKASHVLAAAAGSVTVSGNASATVRLRAGATLEERVAFLERRSREHWEIIAEHKEQARADLEQARAEIRGDLGALDDKIKQFRVSLEDVAVGGTHRELVGMGWLVLGVLAGNIPWLFLPLWPR